MIQIKHRYVVFKKNKGKGKRYHEKIQDFLKEIKKDYMLKTLHLDKPIVSDYCNTNARQ